MRFAFIGSGSRGNGCVIEEANTCLLVDCGFSAREAEQRLARLGKTPEQLTAILVTHEHSDHISGVGVLARKYRIPVWATGGTLAADRLGEGVETRPFCTHSEFAIDDVTVQPFPVPHDAREPSQFVFSNGAERLGLLTDTGSITAHIETQLSACDALILECNHDRDMLARGDYPPALKQRVGGELGHLSNAQAAAMLGRIDTRQLQQIVAAHLSEKHNTPYLAREMLSQALGCTPDWIAVADQDMGLDWRDI